MLVHDRVGHHNTGGKPKSRLEVRSKSTIHSVSNSTHRLREYFKNSHNNFVGKEGGGKNNTKGPKIMTPKNLVRVFNQNQELSVLSPGESEDIVGSPAKRARTWGHSPRQPDIKGNCE